jgi:hypothetical protein
MKPLHVPKPSKIRDVGKCCSAPETHRPSRDRRTAYPNPLHPVSIRKSPARGWGAGELGLLIFGTTTHPVTVTIMIVGEFGSPARAKVPNWNHQRTGMFTMSRK